MLGPWLEQLPVPPHAKTKVREIFDTARNYRGLYAPLPDQPLVDTTWVSSWGPALKLLLKLVESAIFTTTGPEDSTLRQAYKDGRSAEETMGFNPWKDQMTDLMAELASHPFDGIADLGDDGGPSLPSGRGLEQGPPDTAGEPEPDSESEENDEENVERLLELAVRRYEGDYVAFVEEPSSPAELIELFKAASLSRVQPSSGNVLIIIDGNSYGVTDARPRWRHAPMGAEVFKKLVGSLAEARCGSAEPQHLNKGDLWVFVDSGLDRKRHFLKNLKVQQGARDPERNRERKFVLHCTEASVRERRGTVRGHVKCSQGVHLVHNALTAIPPADYNGCLEGSNCSDLLGPVVLEPWSALQTLDRAAYREYWGKRILLAGGPLEDGCDGFADGDVDDNAAEAEPEDKYVICPHALPSGFWVSFAKAHGVKHVIDLTPAPKGCRWR